MASARTIRALEQLAQRPGTAHEGIVAKQKLAEIREKCVAPDSAIPWIFRTAIWRCKCGYLVRVGDKCRNREAHEWVQSEIRSKFKKGDRVYYNYWAYEPNCTATVTGYVKADNDNWAWIRLKFDHSEKGWHLSHEPLPLWDAYRLIKP